MDNGLITSDGIEVLTVVDYDRFVNLGFAAKNLAFAQNQ